MAIFFGDWNQARFKDLGEIMGLPVVIVGADSVAWPGEAIKKNKKGPTHRADPIRFPWRAKRCGNGLQQADAALDAKTI